MAEFSFLLTDKEYDKLKRDYKKLCRFAAWQFAAKHGYDGQINSIRRTLMERLVRACLLVKQREGRLDFDKPGFATFCKQVIWKAQEALSGKVPGLGGAE